MRNKVSPAVAMAVCLYASAAAAENNAPQNEAEVFQFSAHARDSIFFVIDPQRDAVGVSVKNDDDLERLIDPTVACDECEVQLRCKGAEVKEPLRKTDLPQGGIVLRVPDLRGKTISFKCADDEEFERLLFPGFVPLVPIPPPPRPQPPVDAGDTRPSQQVEPPWYIPREVEGAVSVPITSTHDLLSDPGAKLSAVWRDEHFGGRLGLHWNPTRQRPFLHDARFKPRDPEQSIRGNAFGVMAEGFARVDFPEVFGPVGVDLEGGLGAGVFLFTAGRHLNVGVDSKGFLADVPGLKHPSLVVGALGQITFQVNGRVGMLLGTRFLVAPVRVPTQAGDGRGSHLTALQLETGIRVSL